MASFWENGAWPHFQVVVIGWSTTFFCRKWEMLIDDWALQLVVRSQAKSHPKYRNRNWDLNMNVPCGESGPNFERIPRFFMADIRASLSGTHFPKVRRFSFFSLPKINGSNLGILLLTHCTKFTSYVLPSIQCIYCAPWRHGEGLEKCMAVGSVNRLDLMQLGGSVHWLQ